MTFEYKIQDIRASESDSRGGLLGPVESQFDLASVAEADANKWFEHGSVIRMVSREALGLLGGGRAVLLQLAHPLIAAGVLQHSDFQADPLSRLLETVELMHTLIFGDGHRAQAALGRFYAIHAPVRGRLPEATGRYAAGNPYRASDPGLKLWVLATLVETSLITYELFVADLSAAERKSFYQDSIRLARLLKIPKRVLPPTLAEFRNYMVAMLNGDTLKVNSLAKRLAREVLYPCNASLLATASAGLLRFVTAGLLPARFRKAYGMPWSPRRQIMLNALSRTTRGLRPRVPAWVWRSPMLGGGLARFLLRKNDPRPADHQGWLAH